MITKIIKCAAAAGLVAALGLSAAPSRAEELCYVFWEGGAFGASYADEIAAGTTWDLWQEWNDPDDSEWTRNFYTCYGYISFGYDWQNYIAVSFYDNAGDNWFWDDYGNGYFFPAN